MSDFEKKCKALNKKFPALYQGEKYPTGSVVFDSLFGGGVPKGSFVELASKSGLGKTTAVLHFCKVICELGKKAVFLDFEKGVNRSQLEGIGLSKHLGKKFLLLQPVTFEDAEDIIDDLLGIDDLAYICVDSVTAMTPRKMREQSVADIQPGIHARFSSRFLLKYKSVAKEEGITFFWVNQMRYKLNFRGQSSQQPAGGNAQKFYMDIRTCMNKARKLDKKQQTMDGEKMVPYGADVNCWTLKNRFARPFIELTATIIFGKGVSNLSAYEKWMLQNGLINRKHGGWMEIDWKGEKVKKRGTEELRQWIKKNSSDIRKYIEDEGGFDLVAD